MTGLDNMIEITWNVIHSRDGRLVPDQAQVAALLCVAVALKSIDLSLGRIETLIEKESEKS